jgi:hypothetical protein
MMRNNGVRGLVFALLPTLVLTSPAIGNESSPTQLVNNAPSTNTILGPANLNTEPEQTSQSVQEGQPAVSTTSPGQPGSTDSSGSTTPAESTPVAAEALSTPTVWVSTKVPTSSRAKPSTIAGAINTLKLVEKAKTPKGAQKVGKAMAKAKYGWGERQYTCLNTLWTKESRWNYRSRNKVTGAHGIPQAYPATKYESIGSDWRTNPITQMTWGLKYIKVRYQTPCKALSTFYRINMY